MPIRRVLANASYTSLTNHAPCHTDPTGRSARARRDAEFKDAIKRVCTANQGIYGAREAWHRLSRDGTVVAHCTVERLIWTSAPRHRARPQRAHADPFR